jgi:hypothetical protein
MHCTFLGKSSSIAYVLRVPVVLYSTAKLASYSLAVNHMAFLSLSHASHLHDLRQAIACKHSILSACPESVVLAFS